MSIKYRKLIDLSDDTEKIVEPIRRRSEPVLEFDEISECFGYRRASLPPEYSKLHGLLQRLSSRRRARSDRNSSSKQDENESSPAESETNGGALEMETGEVIIEHTEECQKSSTTKRKGGSYKYRKLRHTELYRSQSDALFPGSTSSTVLVK